jgi:hypothetical protein
MEVEAANAGTIIGMRRSGDFGATWKEAFILGWYVSFILGLTSLNED